MGGPTMGDILNNPNAVNVAKASDDAAGATDSSWGSGGDHGDDWASTVTVTVTDWQTTTQTQTDWKTITETVTTTLPPVTEIITTTLPAQTVTSTITQTATVTSCKGNW